MAFWTKEQKEKHAAACRALAKDRKAHSMESNTRSDPKLERTISDYSASSELPEKLAPYEKRLSLYQARLRDQRPKVPNPSGRALPAPGFYDLARKVADRYVIKAWYKELRDRGPQWVECSKLLAAYAYGKPQSNVSISGQIKHEHEHQLSDAALEAIAARGVLKEDIDTSKPKDIMEIQDAPFVDVPT